VVVKDVTIWGISVDKGVPYSQMLTLSVGKPICLVLLLLHSEEEEEEEEERLRGIII
jgi:hypothetical protein